MAWHQVNCAKDAAFQTCQEHQALHLANVMYVQCSVLLLQVFAVPMLRAGITKDQFVDAVGYQVNGLTWSQGSG